MRDSSVPNNLPPRRPAFLGRERELGALDELFATERRVAIVAGGSLAALAAGGAGGSALALAYAHRAALDRTYPGGVWWLYAGGSPIEALARLAPELRLLGPASIREALDEEPLDAPLDDIARAVRAALQNDRERSLLVLDDADAEGWPDRLPLGEVRVLMAARDPRAAFRKRVQVGPLSAQIAADVPRVLGARPRGSDDRHAMESLAGKELAGLPIALTLAALYVKDSGRSWTAYAGRLRTQTRLITEERDPPAGYPASALAAVDIAIDRCARDTPARRLLEGAAVFAPESTPIVWAAGAADLDLDRAELGTLAALGLLTIDEATQTLSMHRLVHRRVRDLVPMDAWVAVSRRAAATAAVWLAHHTGRAYLAELDARRAHIDEALAAADRSGSDLAWVIIADHLAVHLGARGRHEEALSLFERALTLAERLDPPNPGQVRATLSNLGGLLLEMGRAREARPILERALTIDESVEEASVSVRLARLSRALVSAGRKEVAVPLLSRALTMGDPSGEQAAPSLPDSALVLRELKQVEVSLLVHALAGEGEEGAALVATLRAVEQGASSPPSGRGNEDSATLRSLGLSLYALGHPGDARPLLESALACDEAAHGPNHPDVAADLLDLSVVLRSLGEDVAARAYLVRARAIASLLLGPDDPLRLGIEARLQKL